MLKIKKVNEVLGKRVYTDGGDFFGDIEEANLRENKVDSWRIKTAKDVGSFFGGARGVIIPHQFVKAIGDILIINKASLPEGTSDEGEEVEVTDLELAD